MSKKLRWIAIVVVVLGLVVYFGLGAFLGTVVKTAVNRVGPKLTQTKVELAGARISPFTGSGELTGLAVANPAGWSEANALYLGRISISLKPFSIFGDHIVIADLEIDQPEFLYETKVLTSNLKDLLKNIGSGQGDHVETASNGQPIKFEVRHLKLTRGKVTLGMGGNELPLTLPTVELRDLGTGTGGMTADQLALAILKSVSNEVAATAVQAASKMTESDVRAGVKKATESLKKMLEPRK